MTKRLPRKDPQKEFEKKEKVQRRERAATLDRLQPPDTPEFLGMVSKNKARRGHNCLHKDNGQTHVMRTRCFDLLHMGVCPQCKHPASMRNGCGPCGTKPRDLMTLKEAQASANGAIQQWRAEMEASEKARRAESE